MIDQQTDLLKAYVEIQLAFSLLIVRIILQVEE